MKRLDVVNGLSGFSRILVSMLFAGISGSTNADTAGIGSILIPLARVAIPFMKWPTPCSPAGQCTAILLWWKRPGHLSTGDSQVFQYGARRLRRTGVFTGVFPVNGKA